MRSDGLLSLAPRSRELFDTSAPYLWALAHDSKGNLYTAGGTGAKLFRIPPGGPGKMLAEVDALEIHALAVDSKDRVYFGTAPDGKVYRVTGNSKPEVFYDPKAKYIWALAFNSQGNLLVATGGMPDGQGEIHKVTPDGKGSVFFRSEETHIRSMAVEPNDNLIVGTDFSFACLRVPPGPLSAPAELKSSQVPADKVTMNVGRLVIVLMAVLGAAALAQEAPKRVSRSEALNAVISKVDPVYPPAARQLRIQGVVELDAYVSETGDVSRVQILKGNPLFTAPAAEAVKHWKFRPFLDDGKAVAAVAPLSLNFHL